MADDTGLPVAQARVDRGSDKGVDRKLFGPDFIVEWSLEAIETDKASVSPLLGGQLVLKMSGMEVLDLLTPEVEMGIARVVSEGLNGLRVGLASVFSAKAWEDGRATRVPLTVPRPCRGSTEPDAKNDVPTAGAALGEPETSKVEAVSMTVQGPDEGAVVEDQVGWGTRADVRVSVARLLSVVLTRPSGLGTAVWTGLVPMVVRVVVTRGGGSVLPRTVLSPAGDEVRDGCPGVEATPLVSTRVMATRVSDPVEGKVDSAKEFIRPPKASVSLVLAWPPEGSDVNGVSSAEVRCNVLVVSGDVPGVRPCPAVCLDHLLADE